MTESYPSTVRRGKRSRGTGQPCGVEAAFLAGVQWRRSSRSTDKANCVEVAITGQAVAVRDSKHPTGAALVIPPCAWAAFTAALGAGELG